MTNYNEYTNTWNKNRKEDTSVWLRGRWGGRGEALAAGSGLMCASPSANICCYVRNLTTTYPNVHQHVFHDSNVNFLLFNAKCIINCKIIISFVWLSKRQYLFFLHVYVGSTVYLDRLWALRHCRVCWLSYDSLIRIMYSSYMFFFSIFQLDSQGLDLS